MLALALREGIAAVAGDVPLTSVLLTSVALWTAPSASPSPGSRSRLQFVQRRLNNAPAAPATPSAAPTTGLAASFTVLVGSNATTGVDAAAASGSALGAWVAFCFSAKAPAVPIAVTSMLASLASAAGVSDAGSIAANGLLGAYATFLVALPSPSSAPHLNLVEAAGPNILNLNAFVAIVAVAAALAGIVRFRATLWALAVLGLALALKKVAAAASGMAAELSGTLPTQPPEAQTNSELAEAATPTSRSRRPLKSPPANNAFSSGKEATSPSKADSDVDRAERAARAFDAAEVDADSGSGSRRASSPVRNGGEIGAGRDSGVVHTLPGQHIVAASQLPLQLQSRASSPLRGSRPRSSPSSTSSSPRRATLAGCTPLALAPLGGGASAPAAAAVVPKSEAAEAAAKAAAKREAEKLLQWQMRVLGEQAQRLHDLETLFERMLAEQVAAAGAASASAAVGGGAASGAGILSRSPRAREKPQRRRRLPLPGSTWEAALVAFDADDPADAFAAAGDEDDEPASPTEFDTPRGSFAKSAGVGVSFAPPTEGAQAAGGASPLPSGGPSLSGSRGPSPTASRRGSRRGSPAASCRGSRFGADEVGAGGTTTAAVGVSGVPSSVLLSIRLSLAGPAYRLG